MGETVLVWGSCPCFRIFSADRTIEIDGQRPIPEGGRWVAKYQDKSQALYLLNNDYHPDLLLVLRNGKLDIAAAILQYRGARMNRGRTWKLADPADAAALLPDGATFLVGWRVQYLGPLDGDLDRLRFSIEDLAQGFGREDLGQVTYVHDLKNGPSFVIRGRRILIEDVAADGIIRYSID